MKHFLLVLSLMGLAVGCSGGPKTATDEEGKKSMDASMAVDTMKEAAANPATGAGAGTPGAAAPGAAAPTTP